MALSGIEIYKLLPKTNCKDCGQPTCLAFAMQLAMKKASLDQCPHASEEAKQALESASAPPIKKVAIGEGEGAFETGAETVMYRHEDKFYSPTGIAIAVEDTLSQDELKNLLGDASKLVFERIGQEMKVNAACIKNASGDAAKFAAAAGWVADNTSLVPILSSTNAAALKEAVSKCAAKKPLIDGATPDNLAEVAPIAKEAKAPLAVMAEGLEELADLTEKAKAAGCEDLVLHIENGNFKEKMQMLTKTRMLALRKTFRPLGYPTIVYTDQNIGTSDAPEACAYLCKYAGIVVVKDASAPALLSLMTARMNLYTDPQKPVQVEPKLYEIGQPDENSPLMFTTNFSLTYYSVEGEVEASRVPAYILCVDTEGTSVLTAYSGDKLNEKIVKQAMEKAGVEKVVKHKKIIIPGYVAEMSGALEDETGWEVIVGPREASVIPKFLQEVWKG
jgi:acetyl-CoA decarbonylase/synthase complex subunit gamma